MQNHSSIHHSLLDDVRLASSVEVRIEGADPVLPTRFRIGEAAAAAIAAGGVAAAEIHALRGGGSQSVSVDVARATASLLSFAFLQLETGGELRRPALDNPTVALYRAGDGRFVHLHGGFPHLEQGILGLLDVERDREAIAGRVEEWNAFDLEQALADRGLCGAAVRTAEEWRQHEQGRCVGSEPRVTVDRVGDAAAVPLQPADRPLSGVRVLDLTRVLAGPTVGRTLAEHGADVLKISAPHLPSIEPFVVDTGHGKRSAHLDLRRAEAIETLHGLVREADVVVEGYRAGALARRGLSERELRGLNPGLVHVQISCYGHTGPWRRRRGWEQLAQTVSGIADENGTPEAPCLLPAAACDYTTGYLAALGTMAALHERAREGGGYRVRASLTRTAMWLQDLARVDGEPSGLDPDRLARWRTTRETPWGRLLHLGPVVQLTRTPASWEHPVVPLGTHLPRWSRL